MPKSAGSLVAWTISTLLMVAVGIFVLSRVPMAWNLIYKRA